MIRSGRGWRKPGTCEALHRVPGMERWRRCISSTRPDVISPQTPREATAAARGQSSAGVAAWAGAMARAAGAGCHPARRG